MPGTTPVYGFPYPEPTDLVADYPALGQDLAEDIEAVLPTLGGMAAATPSSIANAGGTATLSANTVTFSGCTSVAVNGVFTSTYTNYRVVITTTGSTADINLRGRTAGADNANASYNRNGIGINSSGTVSNYGSGASQTAWLLGNGDSGSAISFDIFGPQATLETSYAALCHAGTPTLYVVGGQFTATTSFDGFSIFPSSSTFAGTIACYAYRK